MNKNLYQPVLINTALVICFVFSLYGLVLDLPFISEYLRTPYSIGRVFTALICLFFFIQVNVLKKQYESQVPMIYSLIIIYCVQGQYFVNGYYLAFMQAVAGFSLFFAMPKKYYYPITIVGNGLIIFAVWNSMYAYSETPEKALKFNIDTTLGVILISVICFIGYLTITLAREKKQILAAKFLDVGRYFGNFVHELKGMVSAPMVYSELLSAELAKEKPDLTYIKEIAENLKIDVSNVNQKVLSINSLSKNSDEVVAVDIKQLIEVIEQHFFPKDNLNIEIKGDTERIIGNEYSIRSIILNLLNNSKENFTIKNITERSVQITIEPQKITFKDNGGGFSKEALRKISQDSFFSEKAQGSGMGLYMVKEYMKEFNGHAIFKNRTDDGLGCQVELLFSKRERT